MKISLTRATEWDQVEEAAMTVNTCIRPSQGVAAPGPNWVKAKRTWETHGKEDPKSVVYFIIKSGLTVVGYMRFIQVDNGGDKRLSTWVMDYANPFSYTAVSMGQQELDGLVLVKEVAQADDFSFVNHLTRLRLPIPALTRFQYTSQRPEEATWLILA